jgi:hypothetical protein
MDSMETADPDQSIDRIPGISERLDLPPRHDTVLAPRDLG